LASPLNKIYFLCGSAGGVIRFGGLRQAPAVVCHLMKITIAILTIASFLTSCNSNPKTRNEMLDKVRKDFAKDAKKFNEHTLAREKLIDSIYKRADTDQTLALKSLDNLIVQDSLHGNLPISEIHFIKGDIYYRLDSLNRSIEEFTLSGGNDIENSPKCLAARAGAFIKNKQFDRAFEDLTKAAEINHAYYWNIGNYYEIIGQKDSAVSNYERLYMKDKNVYSYCKDRIEELSNKKPRLLTNLIYKDRERVHILLQGIK